MMSFPRSTLFRILRIYTLTWSMAIQDDQIAGDKSGAGNSLISGTLVRGAEGLDGEREARRLRQTKLLPSLILEAVEGGLLGCRCLPRARLTIAWKNGK